MTSIKALTKGDKIAIVAPSGIVKSLVAMRAKKYLTALGYQPQIPKGLLKPHLHFANTDDKRFYFLKEALLANDTTFIWSLRGGSGAQRLLPYLDKMAKPKHKKIFIGFSDNSLLQNYFAFKWDWASLHAPVLNRMSANKQSKAEEKLIWDFLTNKVSSISGLKPVNALARKKKSIGGKIVGGNLTTLQAAIGSSLRFKAKSKILFLEDVSELPYRIDRALVSLEQAGVFTDCKGIVLGDFTNCNGPKGSCSIQQELNAFAAQIKIPVYKGLKVGHGKIQQPMWLNVQSQILNSKLIMSSPLK
jgi:muramoyltetrapeptide carboxypeptidase